MPAAHVSAKDDLPTVIAISALACILQDVLHEGLGHGVTAWLSGARQLTLSTVALQSDIDSRWISANGTLVNLFFAGILWLLLLKPRRYKPATFYFLVLAMAGNLLTAQATSCSLASPTLETGRPSFAACSRTGCGGWAWSCWAW